MRGDYPPAVSKDRQDGMTFKGFSSGPFSRSPSWEVKGLQEARKASELVLVKALLAIGPKLGPKRGRAQERGGFYKEEVGMFFIKCGSVDNSLGLIVGVFPSPKSKGICHLLREWCALMKCCKRRPQGTLLFCLLLWFLF